MTTQPPPEPVLELLRKVKALADAGHAGERDAARARLDALLAKHNLTGEQLTESEGRLHSFTFKNRQEQLLILVIAAHVANGRRMPTRYVGDSRKNKVWLKLTPSQIVDVETRYEFYRRHWKDEQELFFRAFIFAQNLSLAASDGPARITTDEELQEQRRVDALKMFIAKRTPHRQLQNGRRHL